MAETKALCAVASTKCVRTNAGKHSNWWNLCFFFLLQKVSHNSCRLAMHAFIQMCPCRALLILRAKLPEVSCSRRKNAAYIECLPQFISSKSPSLHHTGKRFAWLHSKMAKKSWQRMRQKEYCNCPLSNRILEHLRLCLLVFCYSLKIALSAFNHQSRSMTPNRKRVWCSWSVWSG